MMALRVAGVWLVAFVLSVGYFRLINPRWPQARLPSTLLAAAISATLLLGVTTAVALIGL